MNFECVCKFFKETLPRYSDHSGIRIVVCSGSIVVVVGGVQKASVLLMTVCWYS